MNDTLKVIVGDGEAGTIIKSPSEFVFNYYPGCKPEQFVSLTMPVREKSYVNFQLHPIFEMHLPEGYLLSIIKKHFAKLTDTDDFGLLRLLAESVRGRVRYDSSSTLDVNALSLEDILHPTNPQLFDELVQRFALSSPLSGVQPKVLARIENKATLKLDDYIIKTWGNDYPELALNEFLCMQAVKNAGISTPDFYLSDDDQFFIMKRFDIQKDEHSLDQFLGFEDMCVLQAKQRDDKYKGSYEQVAKSLQLFCSGHTRQDSLVQFFKMMVMNTLLQNGDAHLKNFGVLYSDIQNIAIAPAYDIVSTTVYIQNDIPALTLLGSKRWHTKEKLIRFGIETCRLSNKQTLERYEECLQGMKMLLKTIDQRVATETQADKLKVLLHLKNLAEEAK